MDPYQVVFDQISDKDIIQHILGDRVDRASLVGFIPDSLLVLPKWADVFH